ncbi:FAD-binding protein [Caldalkalibacillus thermarum]|uniref:FAD-binding oxidoreductase n=1 Tax=Caldalkalibacillus thermarum TaxID=296745 RepID=UPI0016659ADA|nr:FAD-linked oxidase C-terminal domain-containing protein [Caldalkalibacillus thermarum]GGK34522.1 FAD-binding protein [Caldalkalibacillus thermarum]
MIKWQEEVFRLIDDSRRIFTAEADRHSYAYDASFGYFVPEMVVQPISTAEVVHIVKLANLYKIPLYPRGQGSCLSGGPLPVRGGIVLDLTRMDQKLELYPEDLVAVVSPGVKTADIKNEALKHGLFYPPDPSSAHVSTIGGNVAENSGGPRGLKYGVTRDYVLGLEVVTPEGKVIRTGGRTIKNVTGYDLTKLLVGSEGTLGVITEISLRLIPKPPASMSLMAVFDRLVDSGKSISAILSSGILPAAMEIMDQACIQAVEQYKPGGYPVDAEAILLVELDGHPRAIEDEMKQVEKICQDLGAREVKVARSEREKQRLWQARKLVSPAIARIKPTKISEDATVPRSRIPDMFQRLMEIRRKYNLQLVVFGHAGDGNLHPNLLVDKRDEDEMRRAEEAITEIFEAAIELGGTLSGEHGIGTMKAPYMERELGVDGVEMMKRIKQAWDPNNIMNPGKIFPEPGVTKLVLR